jgi:hypothetical protein
MAVIKNKQVLLPWQDFPNFDGIMERVRRHDCVFSDKKIVTVTVYSVARRKNIDPSYVSDCERSFIFLGEAHANLPIEAYREMTFVLFDDSEGEAADKIRSSLELNGLIGKNQTEGFTV